MRQTQRLPYEVGGPTMGLRLTGTTEPNNVTPLYYYGTDTNTSFMDKEISEPAGLNRLDDSVVGVLLWRVDPHRRLTPKGGRQS
jgi:hypothetical protein